MLHFVLVLVLVLAAPGGALAADALAATDKTDNIVGRALHAIKSTCQKVKRKVQKKRQEYKALKREYHDMLWERDMYWFEKSTACGVGTKLNAEKTMCVTACYDELDCPGDGYWCEGYPNTMNKDDMQLAACEAAHAARTQSTRNRTSVRRAVCGTGRGARGGRSSEARPRNSRGCQRLLP